MKRYKVIVTEHALLDLDDIAHHITLHDGPDRAEEVARRIERAYSSLSTLPHRGNYPRELLELGNRTFREVHFKPYRIVYRVLEREVVVLIVADGRRDMHALMARRLFGA
jgi:toxin ParE1/3/4